MTVATGGTESDNGIYHIHKFLSNGNLTVTAGGFVELLGIGGGGGGGVVEPAVHYGNGGGGGRFVYNASIELVAGVYAIVIGTSGAAASSGDNATNGGDTTFASTVLIASGGYKGSYSGKVGGGNADYTGGTGSGTNGGGGAGSGANGSGSNGGIGNFSTIIGTHTHYGGGGGGGQTGTGGEGGGGAYAASGATNTGGGGGGQGGNGGTGVFFVSYIPAGGTTGTMYRTRRGIESPRPTRFFYFKNGLAQYV